MSTYIYSRTSTNEQNVNQQAEYLAEKHIHDFSVTEQFTGTTTERPKFQKLINQLTNGDKLIVREVSRIGRNTSEVLEIATRLKSKGVKLIIDNLGVDLDTPAGELVFTILAAAAKMEKDLLLERQAIGIARAKAEGKYTGRKPLDLNVIQTAKNLIASGMSKAAVPHQLKIGESTLYRYLKAK